MESSKEPESSNLKLSGHYRFSGNNKTLEIWLEEDGFFRLSFEEKENEKSFTHNDEKGQYKGKTGSSKDAVEFNLCTIERQWKWQDDGDGDSGVDATDVTYPAVLKGDQLNVKYIEVDYELKKV